MWATIPGTEIEIILLKMNRDTNSKVRSVPLLVAICIGLTFGLPAMAQTIWFENFETVELGPNVDEGLAGEKVWGKTFEGWVSDDSGVPGTDTGLDGVTEWAGWSFADKGWWTSTAGDQRRSEFTRAGGTSLIADPDEWDDQAHEDSAANGWFQTVITTPSINIDGQGANSLFLGFDSSWRPEFDSNYRQSGRVWAQFGDGAPVELFTWLSDNSDLNYKDDMSTNEYVLVPLANPGDATDLKISFEMFDAGNDWWWAVDNIAVGVPPLVGGVDVTPAGFKVTLIEAEGVTVNQNSIKLTLDGNALNVSGNDITKDFVEDTVGATPLDEPIVEQVEVAYHLPNGEFFAPGSEHELLVEFTSSAGGSTTSTLRFTVPVFPVISPDMKTEGNTSGDGFTGRVFQAAQGHGNSIVNAERFLDGLELSCATGNAVENLATETGEFEIATVNLEQDGGVGGTIGDDASIPGIPGSTGSTDNMAAEFVSYVDLDKGVHRFGVNSDDGFNVKIGTNPRDVFALDLGSFDGGRGASDSLFDFAVEEAGTYAFRLLWFEGGGGASVEFFSVDLGSGERALINGDGGPEGKSQGPIPAYIDWITPVAGPGAEPDSSVGFKVVSGDDSIDAGSATLLVDGAEVATEVTEEGGECDGALDAGESVGCQCSTHRYTIVQCGRRNANGILVIPSG